MWMQKEESPLLLYIYIIEHTSDVAPVYSRFLIFKKVKINNKYIIFKIYKKIRYVKRKFK